MSAIVLGLYRSAYTESDKTSAIILSMYLLAPFCDITDLRKSSKSSMSRIAERLILTL